MSDSWNTKWGLRRVRHDPPTLVEALTAAQGFTDDRATQAEIAASLMGVSVAEAENELRRFSTDRRAPVTIVAPTRDKSGARTVVVERKTSRRQQLATGRPNAMSRPR